MKTHKSSMNILHPKTYQNHSNLREITYNHTRVHRGSKSHFKTLLTSQTRTQKSTLWIWRISPKTWHQILAPKFMLIWTTSTTFEMANFLTKFTFKEARIKLVTITTFKSQTMNYKTQKDSPTTRLRLWYHLKENLWKTSSFEQHQQHAINN